MPLPRISLGLTIAQLSARATMCGVRRSGSLGEALAIGGLRSEVAPRDGDIDCLVRDMHKPELAPASGILPEQNIFATERAKNFRSEEQPIKREGVRVKGALSQPTGEPPN
jgi:hypothetical protein